MSEKQDLAVLFTLLDKPAETFVKSESFKNLEMKPDLIKQIEPYDLPEVKRLICCSAILAEQEWAVKYCEARKLYDSATWDVLTMLEKYRNAAEFEKKILACVDGSILGKIDTFMKKWATEKEQAIKERSALRGKITKAKKKFEEETLPESDAETAKMTGNNNNEDGFSESSTSKVLSTPMTISKDELRVQELNQYIAERENALKYFAKHARMTESYLQKINDTKEMDSRRQKAYGIIDEIVTSAEEEFLKRYIQDAELCAEDETSLRNHEFLQRLVDLFDKSSYRDMAFPVLSKLYSDNAVDLECEVISKFIDRHSRMLAEYLEDRYNADPDYLANPENRVFLEYSIKHTLAENNDYMAWWNSIRTAADWKIILDTAKETVNDSLLKVAAILMHHVTDFSMNAFWELLESDQAETPGFTQAEFIIELIGQVAPDHRNLVSGYIRSAEQNIRKLQRRVAIKEREAGRHSQELFSALYQPLEQLEELAVNLRLSEGEIKCTLVAGHVINALADLRERLAALGLDTADNVAVWRKQSFVEYDPEKHRMSSMVGSAGERVKLQTLGFSYVDDEGNQKIRAAEVYIPTPTESVSKKTSVVGVSAQYSKSENSVSKKADNLNRCGTIPKKSESKQTMQKKTSVVGVSVQYSKSENSVSKKAGNLNRCVTIPKKSESKQIMQNKKGKKK